MVCNEIKNQFKKTNQHIFWKDIPEEKWLSWMWQVQNKLNKPKDVKKIFADVDEETLNIAEKHFKVGITPYYASLIKETRGPLGLQAIPQKEELNFSEDEYEDPLNEEDYSPVRGLIHKYPDRVLFYTTHFCAMYCRFCTRKRKVSDLDSAQTTQDFENIFNYIKEHKEIRDVVLSGGDPLTFADSKIESIIKKLREIKHVEIIRLGTRTIVTMPQRITKELTSMLKKYAPIYVNTHFNHPNECTLESLEACEKLLDAGCILGNQMVLLKGVNDSPEAVKKLNHKLLMMGVKPYYIYQCDKNLGNKHFRTKLSVGLDIIKKLDVWTSGLAVPQFIKDIEGGGGKIPLHPNYLEKKEGNTYFLRNYKGELFEYKDI